MTTRRIVLPVLYVWSYSPPTETKPGYNIMLRVEGEAAAREVAERWGTEEHQAIVWDQYRNELYRYPENVPQEFVVKRKLFKYEVEEMEEKVKAPSRIYRSI